LLFLGGVGLGLVVPLAPFALQTLLGGEAAAEATATAERFLTALQGDDRATVDSLLLPEARPPGLALRPELSLLRLPFVRAQVNGGTVRGDTADVPFTLHFTPEARPIHLPGLPPGQAQLGDVVNLYRQMSQKVDGQTGSVRLQRVDGRWRVAGLRPPGSAAELGLVTPPTGPKPPPPGAKELEELTAVDPRAFAASWQTDLDVRDRPAGEVLERLARELGLVDVEAQNRQARQTVQALTGKPAPEVLFPEPEGAAARQGRVTVRRRSCSRWEAVEDVCRRAGLYPQYTGAAVRYLPGTRPWPAAFAGPFRVQVEDVREFAPSATGTLRLRCAAAGLPAPVLALLRAEGPALRVTHINAADGRDLYRADVEAAYHPPPPRAAAPAPGSLYEEPHSVPLKNLVRDLDTLHEVRGQVRVVLPTRVARLRFPRLVPGAAQEDQGVRATLRQVEGALAAPPRRPAHPPSCRRPPRPGQSSWPWSSRSRTWTAGRSAGWRWTARKRRSAPGKRRSAGTAPSASTCRARRPPSSSRRSRPARRWPTTSGCATCPSGGGRRGRSSRPGSRDTPRR
jgi:hypothetical protein